MSSTYSNVDWQLMTANYVDTLWDNLTHFYCYSLLLMFMALKDFIVCPMNSQMRVCCSFEKRIRCSAWKTFCNSQVKAVLKLEPHYWFLIAEQMWYSMDWHWDVHVKWGCDCLLLPCHHRLTFLITSVVYLSTWVSFFLCGLCLSAQYDSFSFEGCT